MFATTDQQVAKCRPSISTQPFKQHDASDMIMVEHKQTAVSSESSEQILKLYYGKARSFYGLVLINFI